MNRVIVRRFSHIRDRLRYDGSQSYSRVFLTDVHCKRLLTTQKKTFRRHKEAFGKALPSFKERAPTPDSLVVGKRENMRTRLHKVLGGVKQREPTRTR